MQRLMPLMAAALVFILEVPDASGADEPSGDSMQAIAQDAIDLQNELSAILETVKTRQDLDKAIDRIAKLQLAIERLKMRAERVLSDPDPDRLLGKLASASQKNTALVLTAEKRYQAALSKLPDDVRQALQADSWDALARDSIAINKTLATAFESRDKETIGRATEAFKAIRQRFKKLQQGRTEQEATKLLNAAIKRIDPHYFEKK